MEMNQEPLFDGCAAELAAQALEHAGEDQLRAERLNRLQQTSIHRFMELSPKRFLFKLFGTPCFPRGELVSLNGKPKCGKTFVSSMLVSLCQQNQVLDFERNEPQSLRCLWVDTEQSEDTTLEILTKRILPMVGENNFDDDMLHVHNLRQVPFYERLEQLEVAMKEYAPDLVILDGIRDLLDDINDGVKTQALLDRLMVLTAEVHSCMVCILHQNKASDDRNMRGWLGTELSFKSFEVYECAKSEDKVFSVQQVLTRKFDIVETLRYVVSDQGIPERFNSALTDSSKLQGLNAEYVISTSPLRVDFVRAFRDVLPAEQWESAATIRNSFMKLLNMTSFKWYIKLEQMALSDNVMERKEWEGRVYFRQGTRLRSAADVSAQPENRETMEEPNLFSDEC